MEVIYTGLRQTPESIAETALQEDVAVVGLSILSGAHMTLVPRVLESLKQLGLEGVLVLVGGVIPESDAEALRTQGVDGVFGPGTSMGEVIGFVQEAIEDRRVRV